MAKSSGLDYISYFSVVLLNYCDQGSCRWEIWAYNSRRIRACHDRESWQQAGVVPVQAAERANWKWAELQTLKACPSRPHRMPGWGHHWARSSAQTHELLEAMRTQTTTSHYLAPADLGPHHNAKGISSTSKAPHTPPHSQH